MPSVVEQNKSTMEKQKTGGEPCTFICAVCGDGFSQYQNVLRHMSIHGPLDSFSFDGSSNGFEVPREYVLQDNGTLTVLNGSKESEFSKRPPSPGILPAPLTYPRNSFSPSLKKQSSPREVLATKPLDSNFDNVHADICCEVCSRTFDNLQSLHRHHQYRYEGGYRCTLCCKFFKGRPELKKHFQNHTFESFHCCKGCGKRFVKVDALKNHMTQYHSSVKSCGVSENNRDYKLERTYTCKKCKLTFLWLTEFQIHSYYQCRGKKVSAAFETGAAPKITKDNPQTCNGTSTHDRNGYVSNLMKANFEPDSTYRCGLCGEQFQELMALKEHHKTHQQKIENPSKKIVKSKPKKSSGIRNFLNVKKPKIYHCKLCRCVFRHASSIGRHMRFHKGSTCESCGQHFQQWSELIKHLMLHKVEMKSKQNSDQFLSSVSNISPEGQKVTCGNYKCPKCEKKFGLLCVYRTHLRYHKKEVKTIAEFINTSQNQNPCNDEAKVFDKDPAHEKCHSEEMKENDAVNAENEEDSPEPIYTCTECTQTFTCMETFIQHQFSHKLEPQE